MSSGSLLQPQLSYQPAGMGGGLPGHPGSRSYSEWVLLPPGEPAYEDIEAIWESKWFGPEELSFLPQDLEQGLQRDSYQRETKGLQSAFRRQPRCFSSFSRNADTPSGSQTPSAWHYFSPVQDSILQQDQQQQQQQQQQLPPVSTPWLPKGLSTMQGISNLRDSGLPFVDDHRASTSLPTPIACTQSSDVATPSGIIQGARAISDGDGTGSADMRAVEEDGPSSAAPSAAKHAATVGTWANRQTRLHGGQGLHTGGPQGPLHALGGGPPHVLAPIMEGNPPGAIAKAATPPGQNVADVSKLSLQHLQQQQLQQHEQGGDSCQLQGDGRRDSMDSDAEAGAAWKWRFARRWHIEQTRPADPDGASPDKTEEAIAFLNAGGGAGWNMQVDRTNSVSRPNSTLQSVGTLPGMGSLLAHEMLLDENTPITPPVQQPGQLSRPGSNAIDAGANNRTSWSSEPWQATREVNSLNRRAANLLEQQQRLEAAAEERWRVAMPAEDRWLGTYLPAVEIEEWGTFKFLVCRLLGRGGKQRICVRGRNYYTQSQIIDDISRKVQAVATQHSLAVAHVEIMGGGIMEWRRERDRHLCIYSGYLAQAPPPGVSQASAIAELLNLAAVLTKQSLPAHYKVSIGT